MKVNQYILIFLMVFSFCQNLVGQDYYDVKMPFIWTPIFNSYMVKPIKINNVKVDYINKKMVVTDVRVNPIYAIIENKEGKKEIILKSDSLKEEKLSSYELLTTELIIVDTIVEYWVRYHDGVPWVKAVCCLSRACKDYWGREKIHFKTQDYISIYQPKQEIPTSITKTKAHPQLEDELIVYPSPFKEKITIFFNMPNIAKIELFDTKGSWIKSFQPEWEKESQTLNLSFLATGVYILKIENQQGKFYTSKIVKN